jgi:hypothetical protein
VLPILYQKIAPNHESKTKNMTEKRLFIMGLITLILVSTQCNRAEKSLQSTTETTLATTPSVAAKPALYFQYENSNGSKTPINVSAVYDSACKKFDSWLSEMPIEKPKKCYLAIIETLYRNLALDDKSGNDNNFIYERLRDLEKKEDFQGFIEELKVFPLKERGKYSIAKGKQYTVALDCVLAVFSQTDSLTSFLYVQGHQGIECTVEDWNKDGHLEFVVSKKHTFERHPRDRFTSSIEIYDCTSFDHKIINIFDCVLTASNTEYTDDTVYGKSSTKSEIVFERPDLIKIIEHNKREVFNISEEDFVDSKEAYQKVVNAQKEWLKGSIKDNIVYYQRDNLSKKYVVMK